MVRHNPDNHTMWGREGVCLSLHAPRSCRATRLITFCIISVSAVSLLFRFHVFGACTRTLRRKREMRAKSWSHSCYKRLHLLFKEAMDWSVLAFTFQIICLIVPPLLQLLIFEPCFDCYDFEGAAVHEIGHALGLGHPNTARDEVSSEIFNTYGTRGDNVYNSRIANGTGYDSATCLDPWLDVRNNTPPGALLDPVGCRYGNADDAISSALSSIAFFASFEVGMTLRLPSLSDKIRLAGCVGIRDSVMEAFSQHNPRVCLTLDDLEAIQTIYPDCALSMTTPVCYNVNLNLGFVRVATFILIPLLIVFGLVVLMQAVIQYHNREELRQYRAELKEKRRELVRRKFAAAFIAAGRAQSSKTVLDKCQPSSSRADSRKFNLSLKNVLGKFGSLKNIDMQNTHTGLNTDFDFEEQSEAELRL